MKPLENLWAIVSLPDNIPIVLMLGVFGYFGWICFSEARRNDRLIRDGRREEVLKRMQDG